ncbi:MAG: ferritin-like domain-containing protein, partial [Acidimicrobiales bacterium]
MATTEDMIGRREVDDLESILVIANTDVDEVIHTVADNADAIFTWDYHKGARPALNKLYEKAKHSQWNGETDLPWDTEVDVEKLATEMGDNPQIQRFREAAKTPGSPFERFSERQWTDLVIEGQNWRLSQFMHGEQGALLCTAKIVETVPWIDAKYYASTQVMDEARHVEV